MGWNRSWSFRWGMTTFPRQESIQGSVWPFGYAISDECRQPEAAWQWICFLSEHSPAGLGPGRKSLAESEDYAEQVGQEAAATFRATMGGAPVGQEATELQRRAWILWVDAIGLIVAGESTPREAMEWAQNEAKQ